MLRRALEAACDEARRAPRRRTVAQRLRPLAQRLVRTSYRRSGSGRRTPSAWWRRRRSPAGSTRARPATVSGGAARRRSGAGGTARRSRGNAGDDARRVGSQGQRIAARNRSIPRHGAQPTPPVAPDHRAVSGCTPCALRIHRTRRTGRGQPDRARRGGGHPRLRRDRPARGVRRRHRHDAPGARRRDPRRRSPHAQVGVTTQVPPVVPLNADRMAPYCSDRPWTGHRRRNRTRGTVSAQPRPRFRATAPSARHRRSVHRQGPVHARCHRANVLRYPRQQRGKTWGHEHSAPLRF